MEKTIVSEPKPAAKNIRLDSLFGHLCSSTGLYSRETFLSLYSCITRMVRDHRMSGFVMTRTLEGEALVSSTGDVGALDTAADDLASFDLGSFETVAHALDNLPGLPLFRFNQPDLFPSLNTAEDLEAPLNRAGHAQNEWGRKTGFLIVLTDRMCATLYWSSATHDSFRLYEGGWTFHPGDTRTMAAEIIAHLNHPELERLLQETTVDRRYDDKLNVLITALVNGLENRNRELTVALDQVKMLNKRNVDTERMAAIGQLSSVIAHEIRNPLGLIDLYAKLTEDHLGKLDLSAQEEKKDLLLKNLSLIRQATGSLETILSELTSYSRPLQLAVQPVDINRLVLDVCEFYAPKYDEKGVALQLPSVSGEETLALDADKIRQALINLLKNALEASPAGSAVTVSIARRKNDPQLYIKVADEGAGVDPTHQKKLFTPYFSTKGNGTGLGLAHSRKILQAHGGSVELLSSKPGKGSIFALVLPRERQDK